MAKPVYQCIGCFAGHIHSLTVSLTKTKVYYELHEWWPMNNDWYINEITALKQQQQLKYLTPGSSVCHAVSYSSITQLQALLWLRATWCITGNLYWKYQNLVQFAHALKTVWQWQLCSSKGNLRGQFSDLAISASTQTLSSWTEIRYFFTIDGNCQIYCIYNQWPFKSCKLALCRSKLLYVLALVGYFNKYRVVFVTFWFFQLSQSLIAFTTKSL